KAFQEVPSPQFPRPSEFDLRSFSALQKWDAQVYGFQLPESEFHQKWDSTSDGRAKNLHDFPGSQYLMAVLMGTKKYVKIPVPTLAIFAIPHVPETWMTESTDPGVRKAAAAYFTNVDLLAEKQAKAFQDGVPGARVIRQRGTHYIFISNESDVLREMGAFLAGLK
ncbi:MAG: hypothetical protein DMG42_29420, partial [Acidobacteria bacterium]